MLIERPISLSCWMSEVFLEPRIQAGLILRAWFPFSLELFSRPKLGSHRFPAYRGEACKPELRDEPAGAAGHSASLVFFRDNGVMISNREWVPGPPDHSHLERRDSGSYWCGAENSDWWHPQTQPPTSD